MIYNQLEKKYPGHTFESQVTTDINTLKMYRSIVVDGITVVKIDIENIQLLKTFSNVKLEDVLKELFDSILSTE